MTALSTHHTMLAARLEDILVSEFRAYGELVACSRQERALLSQADVAGLTTLLEQKEKTADELNRLDQRRQTTLQEWDGEPTRLETLSDLLPRLERPLAERLSRLREGILVLVERERELERGNRLLAVAALERAEAMRNFLVHLSDPLEGYRPPGTHLSPAVAASLTTEHWA